MSNTNEFIEEPVTPQRPALPVLSLLKMVWKRRWLALALWVIGSAASLLIVRALPAVYQAHAVVLVDSQKIPENFVSPTVGGDVSDRLALITQSIMTSARLLKIINTYDLYRKERARLTEDELLGKMRADISVSFEKSWTGDRGNAFQVSYQGRNARVVAEVTNRLAGLYVAENTHARERQAENTVVFLDRQLREAKASLDQQEQKVARFKEEHNGVLPEQQSSLLGDLNSLSLQLQGAQASIDRAEENKSLLEASLSAAESADATLRANLRAAGGTDASPKPRSEILKDQLRKLRFRYTPDYPEVKALEQEIAAAQREESAEAATVNGAAGGHAQANPASGQSPQIVPPVLVQSSERMATLRAQIEVATHQIESLQKDRDQVLRAIADCKDKINKLPLVEQEMASLKRNYEESENNYNSLLQKQLAAGVASDMERSRQSEQFTIIDPARIPDKPIKPKRPLLAAGGSIASLAIGLLLGFFLEFRKRNLLGEWELPAGTVVLGRVPVIDMARCAIRAPQV